uniref:tripartite tricarboxylate transporter permease n=1 Tax=Pararhizobium sp. IMCC3301 TaxID=3067904 RepID=UPI002740D672|nr:tripartite tricarboxylate transporter permease [Pararhizobium sp. IMCC3301]
MIQGLIDALTPMALFWTFVGTSTGILVGAIPGLGGGMLMALVLPLTFAMAPLSAILMLIGIHVGSVSGGLISATLLKMPGTPSSVMTTFDGHPMALSGKPERALSLGIGSSLIGGLFAGVVLALLAPPLSFWALKFGPWDLAALILVALVLVAAISQGSMLKGLFSATLGVVAALPGLAESDGQLRYTFGFDDMAAGFRLLPVLLGVFVVSQLLNETDKALGTGNLIRLGKRTAFPKLKVWRAQTGNIIRSSAIGTFVGILPGVGASISAMVAYGMARTFSKTPEKFGTGHDEGIVASEAANNANVGGALIPLITLGIPGAPVDALLLGAMVMHQIQPGPLLFTTNGNLVWAMIAAYFIANIMMFVIMAGSYRQIARVITIPTHYLVPVVFVFCVIGSFSTGSRLFDVWVMLGFGLLGYVLDRARVPLGPFIIGLVLATPFESELRTALQLSDGSLLAIVDHPVALVFVVLSFVMLMMPLLRRPGRAVVIAEEEES